MTQNLKNMLVGVGVVFIAVGIGVKLYTPQPATRTMEQLRDAGILDGQKLVSICPQRLTKQTKRRIETNQPGVLRPSQSYGRIARITVCMRTDGGTQNCIRPADGGWLISAPDQAQFITPSLRTNLTGVDLDASFIDDAGDPTDIDDSLQFNTSDCKFISCNQYDDAVDAGTLPNPYANRFCAGLNRLAIVQPPCMIPNCWTLADGGWNDNDTVDCRFNGPFAQSDGGPRWRGCNVGPRDYAVGSACVPVECSVVAGDNPPDWL